MTRHFHILWGIFYRGLKFLERKFPRLRPSTPQSKFLSGDEQLRAIKESLDGSFKLLGVQLVSFDDTCEVCHALSNKAYSLESRPPIPVPNCPYGNQCRATYAPTIDYGLYKVSQILSARPNLKVQELRKLLREEAESETAEGSRQV
jgi:hypothetical protein